MPIAGWNLLHGNQSNRVRLGRKVWACMTDNGAMLWAGLCPPAPAYVEALAARTSACDLIWRNRVFTEAIR